jgi:hypothetical protein
MRPWKPGALVFRHFGGRDVSVPRDLSTSAPPARRRSRSRLGKAVVNLALAAMALTISLAGAELALRFFYPQRLGVWYPDRHGLTMLWPGLATYLPHFGVSVSVNSFGTRDREHPVSKPEGTFRILVLGDSFVEALQVPFDKSFPMVLESELRASGVEGVEVLNAAVSGWGTDDQLKYLKQYGLHFNPDLILVGMTLHNDVFDNMQERFHEWIDGQLVERWTSLPFLEHKILVTKAFMMSRSHLYALLLKFRRMGSNRAVANQLQHHAAELFARTPPERLKHGWQITFGLLRTIVQTGAEAGARTAIFVVPLSFQLTDAEFVRVTGSGSPSRVLPDQPQRLMNAWGTRENVEVIDLLPEMRAWTGRRGSGLYLAGDGHWSEEGHRVAAAAVARQLVGSDLLARGDAAHSR